MTNLCWRVLGFGGDAKKFAALAQQEVVGHAGDVVADDAMARGVAGLFGILGGHPLGMIEKESKQFVEGSHGAVAVFGDGRFGIEAGKKTAREDAVLFGGFGRESHHAVWMGAGG